MYAVRDDCLLFLKPYLAFSALKDLVSCELPYNYPLLSQDPDYFIFTS